MNMITPIHTAALVGGTAVPVEVEADAKQGLPGIHIVGLGNRSVDEAKERVRSALQHAGSPLPPKKYVVNLAPAGLPKVGAHFDLAVAISLLTSVGQLASATTEGIMFAGELSLDGRLKPIRGAIAIALTAREQGCHTVILPYTSARQASLVGSIAVIGVASLREVILHLAQGQALSVITPSPLPPPIQTDTLSTLVGHTFAKRALVIAAAGRHGTLLHGPPGSGKSHLARLAASLLTPPNMNEIAEITSLHSVAGLNETSLVHERPVRSPHHSVSMTALIGGGTQLKPGEVSLAHHGILILDELPEFRREALEALRTPLEDKEVHLTRLSGSVRYPANFLLMATMNPCPCGYFGSAQRTCQCSDSRRDSYRRRLSGPLQDRFDIMIHVSSIQTDELVAAQESKYSQQHSEVLESIRTASMRQNQRYKSSATHNGSCSAAEFRASMKLSAAATQLLVEAADRLALGTRGSLKVCRVARTIADLEDEDEIGPHHLAEALQFRRPPFTD